MTKTSDNACHSLPTRVRVSRGSRGSSPTRAAADPLALEKQCQALPTAVRGPTQTRAAVASQADRECHSMTARVPSVANQRKGIKALMGRSCQPMTGSGDNPCHAVPIEVRRSRRFQGTCLFRVPSRAGGRRCVCYWITAAPRAPRTPGGRAARYALRLALPPPPHSWAVAPAAAAARSTMSTPKCRAFFFNAWSCCARTRAS